MTPQEAFVAQIVQAECAKLWAAQRGLEQRVKKTLSDWVGVAPRYVEQIPGKRVPYTYIAQRDFTTTDLTEFGFNFQVSEDGPFVITFLTAHWRPTAGSNVGHWRPISAIGSPAADLVADHVCFEYRIQQAGVDRNWQNDILRASKDLFSDGTRPHYLGISGFLERNAVVTTAVTMLHAPSNAGTLKFEYHGYKILAPIAFAG